MAYNIITISRQFGSGGRTIGKEVAEKLGIECYDGEIIAKTADMSGYAEEYISQHGEYSSYTSWFGRAFSSMGGSGMSIQDEIWVAQRQVILNLSEKPCVIVGRCADFILRNRDDVLKVFIHADDESRAKRIVEKYGESQDKPEKRLKDKDKRRTSYYRYYTDTEWGVAKNYHVALDSGKLGLEKCVDIITDLYKG